MEPPVEIITSVPQLRSWVQSLPTHEQADDGSCSCGWVAPAGWWPRDWESHRDYDEMLDLMDLLEGPIGSDPPESINQQIAWLTECIDMRDRERDQLIDMALDLYAALGDGTPIEAAPWMERIKAMIPVDVEACFGES